MVGVLFPAQLDRTENITAEGAPAVLYIIHVWSPTSWFQLKTSSDLQWNKRPVAYPRHIFQCWGTAQNLDVCIPCKAHLHVFNVLKELFGVNFHAISANPRSLRSLWSIDTCIKRCLPYCLPYCLPWSLLFPPFRWRLPGFISIKNWFHIWGYSSAIAACEKARGVGLQFFFQAGFEASFRLAFVA